jgi:CTP synthase (UTP-ammonia lyase)
MKTMRTVNQVEEDIKAKFTKQEIKELRKLGLKNDELLKMDINKAKPFKDQGMAHIPNID